MLTTLRESPHYTVDEIETSLRFACPRRRDWRVTSVLIVFVPFVWLWLGSWSLGMAGLALKPTTLPKISAGSSIIPCMLMVILLVMPVIMTIELFWQLAGREVAEISDDGIIVRHQIFGLGIVRHYRASDINGLSASRPSKSWLYHWVASNQLYWFFDFKQGKIAFNCGRTIWGGVKTFRFGTSLNEEEASQVVAVIHKRFPQYIYKEYTIGSA